MAYVCEFLLTLDRKILQSKEEHIKNKNLRVFTGKDSYGTGNWQAIRHRHGIRENAGSGADHRGEAREFTRHWLKTVQKR